MGYKEKIKYSKEQVNLSPQVQQEYYKGSFSSYTYIKHIQWHHIMLKLKTLKIVVNYINKYENNLLDDNSSNIIGWDLELLYPTNMSILFTMFYSFPQLGGVYLAFSSWGFFGGLGYFKICCGNIINKH